jgi:hypothetical protein
MSEIPLTYENVRECFDIICRQDTSKVKAAEAARKEWDKDAAFAGILLRLFDSQEVTYTFINCLENRIKTTSTYSFQKSHKRWMDCKR